MSNDIKIKDISDRLQDSYSQELFNIRFKFYNKEINLLEMTEGLRDIRAKYAINTKKKSINAFLADYERGIINKTAPVLYGAGAGGADILNYLTSKGIEPLCFCDQSIEKQKQGFCGYKVISITELKNQFKESPIIVSTLFNKYTDEIEANLINSGFESHQVYLGFADIETQYFGCDFMKPSKTEVFADCGAFVGDTALEFFKFSNNNYAQYFGFEPDKSCFEKLKSNLMNFKNINLFNSGVYDSEGKIFFNAEESTGNGHISDSGQVINTISIDEVCSNATFIKMDIEGAELKALKGAKNTIRSNKPKLAICIYHKAEDVIEVPAYLLSLVPEYKLYLRHHSLGYNETVLYAVL